MQRAREYGPTCTRTWSFVCLTVCLLLADCVRCISVRGRECGRRRSLTCRSTSAIKDAHSCRLSRSGTSSTEL